MIARRIGIHLLAAVFTIAMVWSRPSMAQDAKGDNPDAKEIIKAADAAMREARALTLTAARESAGALATRSPRVEATVRIQRIEGEDDIGWKFAIKGERFSPSDRVGTPVAAAYDGELLRVLVPDRKELLESPAAGAGEILGEGGAWVIKWLLRWDLLFTQSMVEDAAIDLEPVYDGRAMVHGVECHVIRVSLVNVEELEEFVAWWFIGVDDHLPRRFDSLIYGDSDVSDGIETVQFRDLKVGEDLAGEVFALAQPEGYTTKSHKPTEAPRPSSGARSTLVGKPAPDFALMDSAGEPVKLQSLTGNVVVLDFWATWCGPCKAAMPEVQKLHERFQGRPVRVFGVNCWESGDAAGYMTKNKFTYGLLLSGDEVAKAYGVSGIPTFVVIGVDGKVLKYAVGFNPAEMTEIAAMIEEHLAANGK